MPAAQPGTQPFARQYRVVQWATGNIGLRALRAVLEHPALRLAGLYVHSEAKAGRDAGELCGRPALGVRATRDIEEIVALRAGEVANWYCSTELDADWDLRPTGWRLEVASDTPLEVAIRFPVSLERWAEVSPNLTAHRPVNAIPYVCEAPPGIRTTLDLPQIVADLR